MLIQSQPGQQRIADGGQSQISRSGREGDQIVSGLHGRYYEKASRGGVYTAFVNALTLAATHASPLTAGTGTPIIGIYNPIGSGVNIAILKVGHTTTSGTPGGPLLWNIVPNPQNITAAANQTATNNGTLATAGSISKVWSNTAVTGSTAGTAFRVHGGPGAVAAGAGLYGFIEEHAGDLIIPPGTMLALCCTAAGTAHIVGAFVTWEEVAI